MRKTFRRHRHPLWNQPDLFQSTPQRPTWRTLPHEIRQNALLLLTRLLRVTHDRRGAAVKEVGDE
jgi:hypothetical protein